jgi:hypothetical protein
LATGVKDATRIWLDGTHLYTLANLVEITGAKRRALQVWAESGALKAEPGTDYAGSGVHRMFSKEEALIACVLHGFARQEVAIGNLRRVAEGMREGYLRVAHLREAFNDSLIGEGKNFLIYNLAGDINVWSETKSHVSLQEMLSSMIGENSISAVLVDLNASVRNAKFRLD